MKSLLRVLNRPVLSRRTAVVGAQCVYFTAAVVLFALAVRKLSSLGLSEGDLVVGLLAAVSCMLLMVLIGLVLPLAVESMDARTHGAAPDAPRPLT